LGFETEAEKEKKMKKQFAALPRAAQEKVELAYHQMRPEEFDEQMAQAHRHTPDAIRLPRRLIQALKTVAESKGEAKYQAMVRKWIEERLQQEAKAPVGAKRQIAKKTPARAQYRTRSR
jgi:hypothetical protein